MTTETATVVVAAAAWAKLFSVFLSTFASECIIHLVGRVTSNLEDGKRENGGEHTKPLRGIRRRGRQSASCPSSLLSTCSHERSHVYISLLRVGGHPLPQGAVLKKEKKKTDRSHIPTSICVAFGLDFVRVFVVYHPPDTKTNFAQKVDSCLCNGSS